MFSAFKKLANRSDTPGSQNGTSISPGGVQSMAHNLQKKFSKVMELSFATNWNILIPISLQPGGVNCWHFKLRLFILVVKYLSFGALGCKD